MSIDAEISANFLNNKVYLFFLVACWTEGGARICLRKRIKIIFILYDFINMIILLGNKPQNRCKKFVKKCRLLSNKLYHLSPFYHISMNDVSISQILFVAYCFDILLGRIFLFFCTFLTLLITHP